MTEEDIEGIETAAKDLAEADLTDDSDKAIHQSALKRMKKSSRLTFALIKSVGVGVYNQLHPSPELPLIAADFDSKDEKAFDDYMQQVTAFLNHRLDELDKAANAKKEADQNMSNVRKFGKGMKKIALHIAPAVKFVADSGIVFPLLWAEV